MRPLFFCPVARLNDASGVGWVVAQPHGSVYASLRVHPQPFACLRNSFDDGGLCPW